ncbi:MAG: FAD-dependent oxidoreductase, partial [Pseudomonadota bacterium]|nr:FAD-dependent oxidoreductase [Pseudomonadota bacterium]
KFAATAARLQGCGLAGVELHGAHGYLINQFLSPWSNRREDDWGGDLDGRSRFVREIVAAIRAACGPDFILGLKMPGTESVDGGIDPDEAARITSHLAALGSIDYFAYGQGNFSLSLENHVPDMYFQPGHFLDIHKQMRTAAKGTPVMALGRIGDPALAERAIADGQGDLIGMSRAQISDAAFANKAHRGAAADIRPCVFDNSSWGEIHQGKPLAEFHNPMLGLAGEADWSPPVAQNPKRVAIIGAGPAGLEAAWVAAARGHQVALFGTDTEIGGALRLEARLPGRGDMARIIDHQARQVERHQVALHLGRHANVEDLHAFDAEAVILATGAAPRPPELDAAADAPLISGRDYMASGGLASGLGGGTVMLIDQDQTAATYGLADQLAQDFEKLIIVTPRPHFAQAVNYCSAIGVYRRLYQANVELVPAMRATAFRDGEVTLENAYGGPGRQLGGIDAVVYVTPRRVVASDIAAAAEGPWTLQRVGDCRSPRNLMAAIHGGHHAAMAL